MATGKVRFFLEKKGFGFIVPDDGSEDVFVHYKNISMEGYKLLKRDEAVQYDVVNGDRGIYAENVNSLGTAPEEDLEAKAEAEAEIDAENDLVF